MLFCPTCANLLIVSSNTGYNKWACNTCPYEFPIAKQMTSRTKLTRKQVDDVLGGEDAWKDADSTTGASHSTIFSFVKTKKKEWCFFFNRENGSLNPVQCIVRSATTTV